MVIDQDCCGANEAILAYVHNGFALAQLRCDLAVRRFNEAVTQCDLVSERELRE